MPLFIAIGPGGVAKLVRARDEGHGRLLMAADAKDDKWLSHDHASMDDAAEGEFGIVAELPAKVAKKAVKEASAP